MSGSAASSAACEGVHCTWVTPCSRISPATGSPAPARSVERSACSTVVDPRVSVQSSSSTEMSNAMLVSASHVAGASPTRSVIAAKKPATLRCSTTTPLGLPVEPEV